MVMLLAWLIQSEPAAAQDGSGASYSTVHHLSGWFSVIWPDEANGKGADPLFVLTDDSAHVTYLTFDRDALANGGILTLDRKRVVVSGDFVTLSDGKSDRSQLRASSISLDATPGVSAALPSAVLGSKPWISILCKFKDVSAQPQPLSYFQTMLDNTFPHLDHYWREQSYGLANIAGSGAVGWYTLPQPRSYYVTANGLNHDQAARDCTAVADASVNFNNYVGINLMFNDNLDGYAWGGSWWLTLDGQTKLWYMTWEPPWGYANIGVLAHEMGHGFGLPHSSGPYGEVYDNPWDIMSGVWAYCDYLTDPTFGCVGQGTIAYHKDRLGWFAPGEKWTAPANSSTTVTLERLALPQTANYRMAQIPIAGSSTRFYVVEARRMVGYDVRVPDNGVAIHHVDTTRSEPAHAIDGDNNGNMYDDGVLWLPGETFTDAANGISIAVQSATSTGYVVTINLNASAGPTATPTRTPTRTATPTNTNTPPPPTATRTATSTSVPAAYELRVNCGAATYSDTAGKVWAADKAFAAGSWGYVAGSTYAVAADIINTLDDALYQSERYWATGATPGYRFTVPANGQYEVTLKFAEIYKNAANKRKFDVRIEGVTVLSAYDIFASAGGKNIAAPDQTFMVNVTDGEVTIDFIQIAGFDTPKIGAIQVKSAATPQGPTATPTSAPATATPTRTPTNAPATATATCTNPPAPTATPPAATATPTPAAPAYELRVNAGGAAYTDIAGKVWSTDKAFVAGSWGYVGGSTYAVAADIINTLDDALYQSERYWAVGATPGYRFTVPANGQYEVTLKFAEIYKNAPEKRKFSVRIEGVTVLAAYDIYASAGGKNIAAPDQTFMVNVADGEVTIDFIQIAGFDTPKISAIQVKSASGSVPPTPTTAPATATPTSAPATATPTSAPATATPTSAPATATPTRTPTPSTNLYRMRVNAGGAAFTDTQGNQWQADRPFDAGPWGYDGASAATGATAHAIAGTDNDALYQSDRRWSSTEGTARYRFSVPNGTYNVILHFAEGEFSQAGQRVFSIKIEGTVRTTNYDIYQQAGHDGAATQVFTVSVSDGLLNLVFPPATGQPKINAIEVQQTSAALGNDMMYPGTDDD
jgi:M6 family metalloprotease-like protein